MKFLIVKTSSIGDIIQTFPVLEYLKKRDPSASIDWVVEKEYLGLVQSHPLVREGFSFQSRTWRRLPLRIWTEARTFFQQLREEQYDVLFDLQGNTKSGLITRFARAKEKVGLGWKSVSEFPNFFVTGRHIDIQESLQIQERYLQVVKDYFADKGPFVPRGVVLKLQSEEEKQLKDMLSSHHPRIMIACGSKWPNKQLSKEALEKLLDRIALEDNPFFYFIWGNEGEKSVAQGLHQRFPQSQVMGHLSFPLWQALMAQMDLVIAVDSAALALCGTTQVPSLSFFGPSLAKIFKPLGDHHVAWQGSCPYGQDFQTRCPRLRSCKTGACLKSANSNDLYQSYLATKASVKR